MKKIGYFILILCCVAACSPNHSTTSERRAAQRVSDSTELIRQEKTVAYTDSILQVLLPRVDTLLQLFEYEKYEKYEDKGRYIHRRLKTTRNVGRSHLQVYVADDGTLSMRSYYFGSKALAHTWITLRADSNQLRTKGSLHSLQTEEAIEITTIESDDAEQMLRFVDGYTSSKIQIILEGNNQKYIYSLPQADRQALIASYQLSAYIHDIKELESRLRQASLQVQKYKKRLQK